MINKFYKNLFLKNVPVKLLKTYFLKIKNLKRILKINYYFVKYKNKIMNSDSINRLYNCTAKILDQNISILQELNRSQLLSVLDQVLVNSEKRELVRENLTECLFIGQERPFDLPWWQKLSWSCVFAIILVVATGGNIIVMWIVLGK